MRKRTLARAAAGAMLGIAPLLAGCTTEKTMSAAAEMAAPNLDKIKTVVVIFAENRTFDNLYGRFPGADGIGQASKESMTQLDRDGTPLSELPPVWDGLTAKGVTPPVTQAQTEHLPNPPFTVDDPKGFDVVARHGDARLVAPLLREPDADRRRQERQVRRLGRLRRNARWGYWDGSKTAMWELARKYALADNFFMGAFGGSFLNHHVAGLRLRALLSERRHQPGEALDRGGRPPTA